MEEVKRMEPGSSWCYAVPAEETQGTNWNTRGSKHMEALHCAGDGAVTQVAPGVSSMELFRSCLDMVMLE